MTPRLLSHPAITMNARVAGFAQEDLAPRGHRMDNASSADELVNTAYRQLFFHTMAADREPFLESQFRNGQINVQQLMRGLCLSERFQRWVYRCNSNNEVASHLVQRLLGREVNGEQEKIAWSIVLGQEGLAGLVDALLNSPEYRTTFGADTVPYQRRRLLPSRTVGTAVPLNISLPRYGAYWRDTLAARSGLPSLADGVSGDVPELGQKVALALTIIGVVSLAAFLTLR